VEIKRGGCHCGAVQFEVELHNGFEKLRRCNCSVMPGHSLRMPGCPRSLRLLGAPERDR